MYFMRALLPSLRDEASQQSRQACSRHTSLRGIEHMHVSLTIYLVAMRRPADRACAEPVELDGQAYFCECRKSNTHVFM